MKSILSQIEELKKSEIRKIVDSRVSEFKALGKKPSKELFKELCFCILTANSTAERCIEVQRKVGNGFLMLSEAKLQKKLKENGCRFHTKRAGYISEARRYKDSLKKMLNSAPEKREWLVKSIKGIGYKEASHFLRNIGYDDAAIVDFHIIDVLAGNGLIKKPKAINKKEYEKIENTLKAIAKKSKLTLSELDLYLWYMETEKVLK